MPPPAARFGAERTITIGSLSKAVWGGLRVGWARGDPTVIHRLVAARAAIDLASPLFEQFVATHTLSSVWTRSSSERASRDPAPTGRAGRRARRDAAGVALRAAGRRPVHLGGAARADQHEPGARRRASASCSSRPDPASRPPGCSSATCGSRSRWRRRSSSAGSRSWPSSPRAWPGSRRPWPGLRRARLASSSEAPGLRGLDASDAADGEAPEPLGRRRVTAAPDGAVAGSAQREPA